MLRINDCTSSTLKGMSISPSPRLRKSQEEEVEGLPKPECCQTLYSGQDMAAVSMNSQQKWPSAQDKPLQSIFQHDCRGADKASLLPDGLEAINDSRERESHIPE